MLESEIVVVTGLPRCGTSMMMQMLRAGGVPLLTDGIRAADRDNPVGYFEYEPVKRLRQDASWLSEAEGKAVKIISALLYQLPAPFSYRVVFMHRPLAQVMASQRAMLKGQGQEPDASAERALEGHFARHLSEVKAWLAQQSWPVLDVDYRQVLAEPRQSAQALAAFLDLADGVEKMVRAVEPTLHRQRQ